MNILWFVLIGLAAGFLAGQIMKGKGFGLVGNLVVGILGAILGGWLFGILGLSAYGFIGSIIMAGVARYGSLSGPSNAARIRMLLTPRSWSRSSSDASRSRSPCGSAIAM